MVGPKYSANIRCFFDGSEHELLIPCILQLTPMTAFDLATEAGVKAYLTNTPYACTRAETLTGGIGNWAFRLYLCQPYLGKHTLVLKHGRSYIKSMPDHSFDVQRQVKVQKGKKAFQILNHRLVIVIRSRSTKESSRMDTCYSVHNGSQRISL